MTVPKDTKKMNDKINQIKVNSLFLIKMHTCKKGSSNTFIRRQTKYINNFFNKMFSVGSFKIRLLNVRNIYTNSPYYFRNKHYLKDQYVPFIQVLTFKINKLKRVFSIHSPVIKV